MSNNTIVLVVEDSAVDRKIISRALQRGEGSYELDFAQDGEEALNKMKTREYSAVLLDYSLPRMNGLEILRGVAGSGLAGVPCIMLTGTTDICVAVEAMKLGATDYAVKTADAGYGELLPSILQRGIERHHLIKEKERLQREVQDYSVTLKKLVAKRTSQLRDKISRLQEAKAAIESQAEELRRTYEQLRELNTQLEVQKNFTGGVLSAMNDCLRVVDKKGTIRYTNLVDCGGGLSNEWKRSCHVFFADAPRCSNCVCARAIQTGKSHRKELTVGGMVFSLTASPLRDPAGEIDSAVEVIRDITEQKRAEAQLQTVTRQLETIFDSVPAMIFYKDKENRLIRVNKGLAEALGKPKEELENKSCFELHPNQAEDYWRDDREVMATARSKRNIIEPLETPRGTRWIQTDKIPYRGQTGEVVGVIGFAVDITERRQAEEALRESQAVYHSLVESLPLSVFRKDLEGKFTFGNGLFCKGLGRPLEEIIGKTDLDFFPEQLAQKYREDDRRVAERGQVFEDIEKHQRPDGETIYVQVFKTSVRSANGEIIGTQGMFWDVTDRKRAEAEKESLQSQFHQAQKMESVGTLAAGIAHDFNNLLTAIRGNTELAMEKVAETDPLYADLTRVYEASTQAADVVCELLFFSRKHPTVCTSANVNDIVNDTVGIFRPMIGDNIAVELELDPDLWIVRADVTNIQQVILNLVVNARDAMPGGGKLCIRTRNCLIDREYCRVHADAKPGRFVCFSIEDTGVGIPQDIIHRILEPFFTTKGVGQGTGLGLAAGAARSQRNRIEQTKQISEKRRNNHDPENEHCDSRSGALCPFAAFHPDREETGGTAIQGERPYHSARKSEQRRLGERRLGREHPHRPVHKRGVG